MFRALTSYFSQVTRIENTSKSRKRIAVVALKVDFISTACLINIRRNRGLNKTCASYPARREVPVQEPDHPARDLSWQCETALWRRVDKNDRICGERRNQYFTSKRQSALDLSSLKVSLQSKMASLQHPSYRPDLSPPDFHMYPEMKKQLEGLRFINIVEM